MPDQKGEILMLQYIVGMVAAGNPILHLFKSDVTPDDATTIAQVGATNEVTSAGYAFTELTSGGSGNWTTTQSVSGVTTALYSEVTFTFTTDAVVYGYYVTNVAGDLLWVERFSGAPFQIPDGGGTISITSKITLS
tara:strand:+ start:47 stop:454 length:408 start_codon:yes stop_codon:yes gene_type:complete